LQKKFLRISGNFGILKSRVWQIKKGKINKFQKVGKIAGLKLPSFFKGNKQNDF